MSASIAATSAVAGVIATAETVAAENRNKSTTEQAGTYTFKREIPVETGYDLVVSGGGPAGLYAAFSSDGITWSPVPGPVAPGLGDRTNAMFTRDKTGKYVVFTRTRDMMQRYKTRCVYRIEGDDFVNWSPA